MITFQRDLGLFVSVDIFSHSNLSGANLRHSQLTRATLESWNIDTETRMDDIDCRYYYYLENGTKIRIKKTPRKVFFNTDAQNKLSNHHRHTTPLFLQFPLALP
jgi:uncharacterized protein YjbI with pentapeptide repeats